MEVGGYSLHLYCDTKGCLLGEAGKWPAGKDGPFELNGHDEKHCKRQARLFGWTFHHDGTHSCKEHSK